MQSKNRGMILENIMNKTIKFYEDNDIGVFHKKNLDVQFSKVSSNNELKNAVISKKSTVDYYGVHKGIFVCFEAKSTNETNLPWQNIKEHQFNYLKKIHKHGGLAFFIILFKNLERFFILPIQKLDEYKNEGSLSLNFIEQNSIEMELMFPGIIDFVSVIDSLF
ncbi:Holliday junction resolvase RecU [Mycoplasma procyoni]|uniref:Holliday junction resolvase RecU n=1 Tax=Mycoplasma procyoni TaxID=568784 RepID=UPI00197B6FFC|nr:Holliday junction resolvase RecU [Mycoplasma procyoni]MBN3534421.1 Holliday junction resolvase RecU [Mycoplasma procyoni]